MYEVYDGMNMALSAERGADGAVTGWRLLKAGRNELYKEGLPYSLELPMEALEGAAKLQAEKGERIPIDSRHALYFAAERAGVEESEALKLVPGGVAALGFGELEAREDGLWITRIEWCPLAQELMRQKAIQYFSPVVRGLDGKTPFRVTSVAMDNVPALSGLEVLAAGQEAHNKKETCMEKTLEALRKLVGDDTLALGDEADGDIAAKIEDVARRLAELEAKLAEAEAQVNELKAGKDAAEQKVAEAAMAQESALKEALLGQALGEGRITNAQAESLKGLGSAALGEFLKATPGQAVPRKGAQPKKDEDETVALTDAEKEMAKTMNIAADEMLAAKKRMAKED